MEAVSVSLPKNPPNPPNQDQNLLTAKNYEKQAKYEDKVPSIIKVNFRIFWLYLFRFLFLPNGKLTSTSPLLKLFLLIIGLARVGILIKIWASLRPLRVDIDYGWSQKNGYTMKAIEAYDWSVHFYALSINEGDSEEIQKIQSKIYWIKRRSVYLAKMMDPPTKACCCCLL